MKLLIKPQGSICSIVETRNSASLPISKLQGKSVKFCWELMFTKSLYGTEPSIGSALNIVRIYGPGQIFAAYNNAKQNAKGKNHLHTLCTAHSSKGLEFDSVIIGNDLNNAVTKIITDSTNLLRKTPKGSYFWQISLNSSISG